VQTKNSVKVEKNIKDIRYTYGITSIKIDPKFWTEQIAHVALGIQSESVNLYMKTDPGTYII
jgi:hypothetical protein